MSVQAMGWVFDHSPTKGSDRLVLLSIANHAGKAPGGSGAWEAWPGVELMRQEAGLDRSRTVQDALARLVAAGALEREVNGAPDERIRGDHRPNLYRILLAHGVTCDDTRCGWCRVTPDAGRGDAPSADGVTDGDATGCREASPEPSVEPSPEPVEQPPMFVDEDAPTFAAFWELYPRRHGKRVGKAEAQALWDKLKRPDHDLILVAVVHYAAACNGGVTLARDAERWLSKREMWADTWQTPADPRDRPNRAKVAAVDDDRDAPAGRLDL